MPDSNARVAFASVRSKSKHSITLEMRSHDKPGFTTDDLLVRVGELATALEKVVGERDSALAHVKQLQSKLKVCEFHNVKSEGALEADMDVLRSGLEEAQKTIKKQASEKESQSRKIDNLMSQIEGLQDDLSSMKELNASLIDEIAETRRRERGPSGYSSDAEDASQEFSVSRSQHTGGDPTEKEITLATTVNELTIENNRLRSAMQSSGLSNGMGKPEFTNSSLSLPPNNEFQVYVPPSAFDRVNSLTGLNAALVSKPAVLNDPNTSPRSATKQPLQSPASMSVESTLQRFTMVDDS